MSVPQNNLELLFQIKTENLLWLISNANKVSCENFREAEEKLNLTNECYMSKDDITPTLYTYEIKTIEDGKDGEDGKEDLVKYIMRNNFLSKDELLKKCEVLKNLNKPRKLKYEPELPINYVDVFPHMISHITFPVSEFKKELTIYIKADSKRKDRFFAKDMWGKTYITDNGFKNDVEFYWAVIREEDLIREGKEGSEDIYRYEFKNIYSQHMFNRTHIMNHERTCTQLLSTIVEMGFMYICAPSSTKIYGLTLHYPQLETCILSYPQRENIPYCLRGRDYDGTDKLKKLLFVPKRTSLEKRVKFNSLERRIERLERSREH